MTQHVVVVFGDEDERIEPGVYGPFATGAEASAYVTELEVRNPKWANVGVSVDNFSIDPPDHYMDDRVLAVEEYLATMEGGLDASHRYACDYTIKATADERIRHYLTRTPACEYYGGATDEYHGDEPQDGDTLAGGRPPVARSLARTQVAISIAIRAHEIAKRMEQLTDYRYVASMDLSDDDLRTVADALESATRATDLDR